MALTFHTVRLLTTSDGTTALNGRWTLEVVSEPPVLVNTSDGGSVVVADETRHTRDGYLEWSLPALPQPDIEPADARYLLTFRTERYGQILEVGPFQLTEDATLEDLLEVSGVPVTSSILSQAIAARDAAIQAAQEAIDASGGAGGRITYTQSAPSSQWIIEHNLGRYPQLLIFLDGDDAPVFTDVTYPNSNTAILEWTSPETGRVYI